MVRCTCFSDPDINPNNISNTSITHTNDRANS
jgi:hypothetical protein